MNKARATLKKELILEELVLEGIEKITKKVNTMLLLEEYWVQQI
jgi:hypothetical protein